MARTLNKVLLIGHLGSDPEIKYSPSGTAIANFNLATTETRKNKDGEWEDETEWHKLVFFGKTAEACKDYLKKGSKIYIEGRLQTRSWEDQNNQRRYLTEIVGDKMIMLDSKPSDTKGIEGKHTSAKKGKDVGPDDFPQADDDLPF